MQLSRMMRAIRAKWLWTDENYPGYDAQPEGRARELFRLKHVMLHLVKQIGIVAAAIERVEHHPKEPGPSQTSRIETCGKLLVLALQLADLSGVRIEELETWISKNYPRPTDIDDEVS